MAPNDGSQLYDPASPNLYDSFQPPIDSTDRPPSTQTANPKFLDMDDPGPSAQLSKRSLTYDDPLSSTGPLNKALYSSKKAADQRNAEAEVLFGPIAKILDQHCASNPHLPDQKSRAFKTFCDELVEVASRHFEDYIRATTASFLKTHKNTQISSAPTTASSVKSPTQGYANAVKRSNPEKHSIMMNNNQHKMTPQAPQGQPDDRLFFRLSNNNPLRTYSGFALLAYIKSKLGPDKDLITNVLPVK